MSPPPDSEGVGVGELSRQVRDVFIRFEGLATKLDTSFVTKELYILRQQVIDKAFVDLERDKAEVSSVKETERRISDLEATVVHKTEFNELCKKVSDLEDDKKWLVRLVLGFIILGVLGAIFVAAGGVPSR